MHTDSMKDSIDLKSINTSSVSDTKPYFSVQDLVVGYDDTIVVNGLSFILQQGEIGCFGIQWMR